MPNVAMSEVGMAGATSSVERQLLRKTNTTRMASRAP